MASFVATFFSHFGAVRFARDAKALGLPVSLRPVPRELSSSCGTCAMFQSESGDAAFAEECEAVYVRKGEKWEKLWTNPK
jgi:hypothetical protein